MPFDQIQCADLVGWTGNRHAAGWRKVVESVAALTGSAPDTSAQVADAKPGQPAEVILAVLVSLGFRLPWPQRRQGCRPSWLAADSDHRSNLNGKVVLEPTRSSD